MPTAQPRPWVLLMLSAGLLWATGAAAEPLSASKASGATDADPAANASDDVLSVAAASTPVTAGALDPAGEVDAVALPTTHALPAPLPPTPERLGGVLDIEPDPPGVDIVLAPTIAGLSGCGLVSAPLGTLGFASAIAGVGGVVGVLGAGLTPVIGLPLFAGGLCLGLPAFCLMGPASVGAAAGGAMIATRTYNDRSALPALIAMIPPLLLAFAGSGLATVGLFYTIGALLAISPGGGRAGLAMLSAGLLTSLLAGPLAAFLAVGADVAFGGPFEEGLAGQINDALSFGTDGPALSQKRSAPPRQQVAMAF